jgi:hypothetical protein
MKSLVRTIDQRLTHQQPALQTLQPLNFNICTHINFYMVNNKNKNLNFRYIRQNPMTQ